MLCTDLETDLTGVARGPRNDRPRTAGVAAWALTREATAPWRLGVFSVYG